VVQASPPEKKAWPELPTSGVVAGRPATEEDVKAGNAVFVLRSGGRLVGTPLKLEIPQYAIHVDAKSGEQTPGFIIQAKRAGDQSVIGFLVLPGRTALAATLPEFKLLLTITKYSDIPGFFWYAVVHGQSSWGQKGF
jgi:hypothetical protein